MKDDNLPINDYKWAAIVLITMIVSLTSAGIITALSSDRCVAAYANTTKSGDEIAKICK